MSPAQMMFLKILMTLGLCLSGCVGTPDTRIAKPKSSCPDAASPLVCSAESFMRQGDFIRAAQYLEAAIEHGDRDSRVMALLWRAYVGANRYTDLRLSVQEHLALCPDDAEARDLLAALDQSGL